MFLLLCLTSLCMTISRSIHVAANDIISFFLVALGDIHCIYVPRNLHPFLCWWTFRLLPCLGYCKQGCSEHWTACILLNRVFSEYVPECGLAESYGSSIFSFLRKLHTRDCHTECSKSEREKQILYINAYMWNLEKWYRWTYLKSRNRDIDTENKHTDTKRGKGSGVNWEMGLDIHTLLCTK